jgi:hypothetical protein
MSRILAPSIACLSRVLGVRPAAIRKARSEGKIHPEPDGRQWDLLETARRWRQGTNAMLQRAGRKDTPWLDAGRQDTAAIETALVRRAEEAGLVEQPDSVRDADMADVRALVAELVAAAARAPRWDVAGDAWQAEGPDTFTVAEAEEALASVPDARAWIFFAWLSGGDWWPTPPVRSLRGARHEMVAAALGFIVTLHRVAAPGERKRRIRAAKASERRLEAEWPGVRARVRAIVAAAEAGGADGDDLALALLGGRGTDPTCPRP